MNHARQAKWEVSAYSLVVALWREVDHPLVAGGARGGPLEGGWKQKISQRWASRKRADHSHVSAWGHPLWNGDYHAESQNLSAISRSKWYFQDQCVCSSFLMINNMHYDAHIHLLIYFIDYAIAGVPFPLLYSPPPSTPPPTHIRTLQEVTAPGLPIVFP